MYLQASAMHTETLPTPTEMYGYRSNMSETDSRMYGSSSAMSYASSFDPDNVALRRPIYSGLVVRLFCVLTLLMLVSSFLHRVTRANWVVLSLKKSHVDHGLYLLVNHQ
jgi:hypothetical protein